jgi:hypothetical protein
MVGICIRIHINAPILYLRKHIYTILSIVIYNNYYIICV